MEFIGTGITYDELTNWTLSKFKRYKITDIRYFGSRVHGKTVPRSDSDIDVYILFDGKHPNKPPIFSELYKKDGKNYVIEYHPFIDFHDGYVPTHLVIDGTDNQLVKAA